MVVTEESGGRVNSGENGEGMTEEEAKADVSNRNDVAANMGLKTRYKIAPWTQPTKK
jgi:hypothetical protein